MSTPPRRAARALPSAAELAAGVMAGDRTALSRAVTVVESTRPEHRELARELLQRLHSAPGPADRSATVRVGISGVPGVGKSTFIEALGSLLTSRGHRVGVLAVDPSSSRTGGSVLGDRTRMPRLTADPRAYVRPSPAAGTLGGVTRATAQTIPLLEAAGYDVVLVETVGVGQSEIAVAGMVDTFLLLGLARTGDQLQGIKKGVLEIADVVAINKADGDARPDAVAAAKELTAALRLVYGRGAPWLPPVLTCSALTGDDIDTVWSTVGKHRHHLGAEGLSRKRSEQQWSLAQTLVTDELLARLRRSPAVRDEQQQLRAQVVDGSLSAAAAADQLLAAFDASSRR
ncbi:methylmalonyl Co-A mutase-associated GTPase MeaB [Nakamurella aerolata]|uniref:Methylmalonyl Co-A mutase-associated GTPase MeaB n=1 Tax=Nakamurella aerolata TaxID=1656892 RepID=A0A849ABZ5_9ACTN|nr:methylmalonyl Co-A mutase-associated GTPase MeaB [Nakamurella aerolata]NNG36010.1 methylmalonyl Co-A mutase-associated GTPase MeaB [Nakamurella aerolata]